MRDDKVRIRPRCHGWGLDRWPSIDLPAITWAPGAFDEINARIDAQIVAGLLAECAQEDTALARFADDGGPADD